MLRIFNVTNPYRNTSFTIYQLSPFTCITSSLSITNDKESALLNRNHLLLVPPNRSFSTRIVHPEENVGLLKKILNKVGFNGNSKIKLKVSSYMLYENVADRINYLEFFNEFKLPNTFNSWFLVTELHVWMILLRAMNEGSENGENGRYLRNNIVEAMWADVNTRAKKLGANNPSGTRAQIEILSEQFQAALISYDEGIMSDDKILAGALWRRFFEQNCNNYILLEKLVKYVRKHVQMLDSLQTDEFINKPIIQWSNLMKIQSYC